MQARASPVKLSVLCGPFDMIPSARSASPSSRFPWALGHRAKQSACLHQYVYVFIGLQAVVIGNGPLSALLTLPSSALAAAGLSSRLADGLAAVAGPQPVEAPQGMRHLSVTAGREPSYSSSLSCFRSYRCIGPSLGSCPQFQHPFLIVR